MEFRYLLRILRAHWKFVAASSVIAFLGGLAATYVLSEKFEASTKILIRPREEINLAPTNKAMMDFPVSINIPAESMSQTYAEVMTSEAIATRVVDLLHLDTLVPKPDPEWYMRVYHRLRDWAKIAMKYSWDFVRYGRVEHRDPYWKAVDDVVDALEAKPVTDTYIFELTATWDDPKFAALIADTAAKVFVDYSLDATKHEEGTSAEFLGKRAEELRTRLEDARKRLETFSERNGAASLEYQINLKLEDLSDFESSLQSAGNELGEVNAEISALQNQLDEQSEKKLASAVTTKNPVIQDLQEDLARYEVELAGLRQTQTSAHPDVKALMAKIDEAKRRIAAEAPLVPYQESSQLNEIREKLTTKLLDQSAKKDSLEARRKGLSDSIRRYRAEVDQLAGDKKELDELRLEVTVLENEYRAVREQYGQARMAAVQDISDIRIIHPAVAPLYPKGPIKLYYAGGALALGFLAALTLLLIVDYTQPRVVTPDEVEALIGAPVLVNVPRGSLPSGAALIVGERTSSFAKTWRLLADNARHETGEGSEP